MSENFSFGYWLRRQRLARDLRQADLARQLGIAPITLRKIEADERRPSLQLLARLAQLFALSDAEKTTLVQVARSDLSPASLVLAAPSETIEEPHTQQAAALPGSAHTEAPANTPFPHQPGTTGANPFYHRGPVRDPQFFFGRTQEVIRIAEMLRQGQSVAIDGARRFGKTSLLFHLANPGVTAHYGLDPATVRWIYLDGGMLDGLDEDWLYGAIDRGLGGDADSISYSDLLGRLRALASQGQRVILGLDEFELFAGNPQLGRSVFNRLRALTAQLPIQYLTASKLPLLDLTFAHQDTLSSPFFNIFAPLHLSALSDTDADTLLATLSAREGRPFTSKTRRLLFNLVGPHPLFLQMAGYHAFAALSSSTDGVMGAAEQAIVYEHTQADLEAHLRYYWNELDVDARYTLAALPLLQGAGRTQLPSTALLHDGRYLGAAIATFVRRQRVDGLLQGGRLIVDLRRSQAATDAGAVHLTPSEFAALRLFLERPGQVITPEEIEAALWPEEPTLDPERARGVIKKLRAALGQAGEAIINRRGQGYLFQL
jgi:transcriptional regulator with XRE-family HTH domain